MLSDDTIEYLIEILIERLDSVNKKFLDTMAERLRDVGNLGVADIYKLEKMLRYGSDISMIKNYLAKVSRRSNRYIQKIFDNIAKLNYVEYKDLFQARGVKFIPYTENQELQNLVSDIAKLTQDEYRNLSKSTGYMLKHGGRYYYTDLAKTYNEVIDRAVQEAKTGSGYNSSYRDLLKELAQSGLRTVDYESGRKIRLDSAARQALLNGIRNVNQSMHNRVGEELKCDGIELSAHLNCAPDHEEYQGRRYSKKEFDDLQTRLKRPIGKWNCRHLAKPVILGVGKPIYSKEKLQEMKDKNAKGLDFNGKHYSLYEIAQKRNQIETDIKIQKDIIDLMRGDTVEVLKANAKLKQLNKDYKSVNELAGFYSRQERLRRGKEAFRNG